MVRGVLRVARQHNATQIVVGKPAYNGIRQFFTGGWFLRRLVAESGDIDIHVVRAEKSEVPRGTADFPHPGTSGVEAIFDQFLRGGGDDAAE